MSGSAIETWLAHKQKKALLNARFYFVGTSVVGVLASLPNFIIAFLICKLLLLLVIPSAGYSSIGGLLLAVVVVAALFLDCVRAERDDMALIPLWLAREYFHMGPRIFFDGLNALGRARQFAHVDTETSAQLLGYLVTKTIPAERQELQRVCPTLTWDRIVRQLRVIEGVIVFRNGTSVSLLTPLRLELRQLLAHFPEANIPPEEPEAVPVEEPRKLSAHEILGVSPKATVAEIKAAYRKRIKETHPDRFPQSDAQSRALAEEWTKALNAAYAELLAGTRS